jgi:hypothetical protein
MNTFKKFIVAADNHGKLVCEKAVAKFLAFCSNWKPHYRIHLGDLWDFAPLRGGASPEDRAEGIAEDYAAGLKFLDAYKPNYLALGNHDDRIWKLQESSDGIMRERCYMLVEASKREFSKRKIQWIPYRVDQFLQLPEGGPKFIHGFRSTMYPAKAHFENWGPCIHGHVHKPDTYAARHIDGEGSYSVGCLADLSLMHYADRTPAKLGWRQGWLYGLIHQKTGKWYAWHATNEQGNWITPQGVL